MPFYFIQFSLLYEMCLFKIFIRLLITRQCHGRKGSRCEVCSTSNWKEAIGKRNKFGLNKHSRRNIRALNNYFMQYWRKQDVSVRYCYEECVVNLHSHFIWGHQKQSNQRTKWLWPQKIHLRSQMCLGLKNYVLTIMKQPLFPVPFTRNA